MSRKTECRLKGKSFKRENRVLNLFATLWHLSFSKAASNESSGKSLREISGLEKYLNQKKFDVLIGNNFLSVLNSA